MKVTILINKEIKSNIIEVLDKNKNIIYSKSKLHGIDNYMLEIVAKENSVKSCGGFFEMLNEIKELLNQQMTQFEILNNDFSEMFCRNLYPKFQKFELNLRKLLNIAFCDTNDKYKEAIDTLNAKLKHNKQNLILQYSLLESSDLSDIFGILFSDKSFISTTINMRDKSFYTRYEIEKIPDNSLWNTELSKCWPNFKLNEYCRELYNYRNDVMHFHNIDYINYKEALKLINRANREVLMALDKQIIIEPEKVETNLAIVKAFVDNISRQLKDPSSVYQLFTVLEFLKQTSELSSNFNNHIKSNIKRYQDFYNTLQEQLNINLIKQMDFDDIRKFRNYIAHNHALNCLKDSIEDKTINDNGNKE